MCGSVGIIGIFMIIDYFKDFKTNSKKQNTLNTLGLLTAGAGVVLILPLLYSLTSNCFTAEKTYAVESVLSSLVTAPTEIVNGSCSSNFPFAIGLFLSIIIQISMFPAFIFIRKKRRTFAIALVFTAFYLVIVGVIRYSQPNCGALFIFSLVMIFTMGHL